MSWHKVKASRSQAPGAGGADTLLATPKMPPAPPVRDGEGQGEAKRRRVEHGQGAAAVSGSPEGGTRDEGKEGSKSSAANDGESADAGGKRGDADSDSHLMRTGDKEEAAALQAAIVASAADDADGDR